MAIAPVSQSRVAYVAETSFGITPATPSFQEFGRTTGGLRTQKATAVTDEIHADRAVRDEYQLAQDVTGSYDYELKPNSIDDFLAGAFRGAWVSDVLKTGVLNPSFTIEEMILNGGVQYFSRYLGAMISTMSMSVTSRQVVKGSFAFMGQREVLDSTIVTGATYTPSPTIDSIKANQVANLTVTGAPAPLVKGFTINLNNNLRVRDVVGSLYSLEFGAGQADVTGTLDCYFTDNALYQQVLAHGGGALTATMGATANEKYTIAMPNLVFLDGAKQLGGKNDDVMVSIPYRARFDQTLGSAISITRNVA